MSIREIPVTVAGEIVLPNGEVLNINELPSLDNGETYGSIALRAREQGTGNREQQTMKGFQNLEMS